MKHVTLPILPLLGLVFVTLKLLGKLSWSWWWVTLPFWGGAFLWLLVLLVIVILTAGAD